MTAVLTDLNRLMDLGDRTWIKFPKSWRKTIENRHWSWQFEPMDRWELGLALNYTISILFNIIGEDGGGAFNEQEIKRFWELSEEERYQGCEVSIKNLYTEAHENGTYPYLHAILALAYHLTDELCSDVEATALYKQHR